VDSLGTPKGKTSGWNIWERELYLGRYFKNLCYVGVTVYCEKYKQNKAKTREKIEGAGQEAFVLSESTQPADHSGTRR
jgi:hypothetical protein